MLIVCSTCATAYDIDPTALGTAGRRVRCSHCKATWFATVEAPSEALADAAASILPPGGDFQPEPHARHARVSAHADAGAPTAIIDAPSLVPPMAEGGNAIRKSDTAAQRSWWLRSRRKPRHQFPRWVAPVLVVFAASVAVIGSRAEVVRYLPRTAAVFAAIGLPVGK